LTKDHQDLHGKISRTTTVTILSHSSKIIPNGIAISVRKTYTFPFSRKSQTTHETPGNFRELLTSTLQYHCAVCTSLCPSACFVCTCVFVTRAGTGSLPETYDPLTHANYDPRPTMHGS